MTNCSESSTAAMDSKTIGRRQYPSTLTTQDALTPSLLIRLSTAYMPTQPTRPTP